MSPEDLRPAKQARGEQQTDTGAMSSGGAGHATRAVHFADFADEVDPDDGAEVEDFGEFEDEAGEEEDMFFTEEPCLEGEIKPTMFEGEQPPELPDSELEIFDDQAELIEVQRLTRMGAITEVSEGPADLPLRKLTTKFVKTWRHREGKWFRRARLVAREFKAATPWMGMETTFSPATAIGTLRHVFLMALHFGQSITVVDVKDAYLNVPQDESECVYVVDAPMSYCVQVGLDQKVWRCARMIPGQRIAAQKWYNHLDGLVKGAGMESFPEQPTLYRGGSHERLGMGLHVDDFVLTGRDLEQKRVLSAVQKSVTLSVCGPFQHAGDTFEYLKRRFSFVEDGLIVRINPKHVEKLNELCPQRYTKKLPCGHDALEEDTTPELLGTKVKEFRSMVGILLYLVSDRPDLAFVVRTLSSKMSVPTEKAYKLAIGAVAYLRGTSEVGIKFKKNWPGKMVLDTRNDHPSGHAGHHVVEAIADADFAGDKTTRRSISGGQVYINGNVCLAYSRTQKNISLSSGESEYIALSDVIAEAILIKKAWASLVRDLDTQLVARTDSSAGRGIASRRGVGRVRHLDTRYLWVQELVVGGKLKLQPISTLFNPVMQERNR